jgi:hypothetical protein
MIMDCASGISSRFSDSRLLEAMISTNWLKS